MPSEPQTPAEPETPEENQSAAQQIVSAAYSFLGIPYVWGGTTTAGFDCSGMVQALMRQQGFLFHVSPGIREQQELKYLLRRHFREILYIMDGMWESILEMVR